MLSIVPSFKKKEKEKKKHHGVLPLSEQNCPSLFHKKGAVSIF